MNAGRSARRARASQSPRSARPHAFVHLPMERAQPALRAMPPSVSGSVAVRRAVSADVPGLERLAALDSRRVPPQPVLVAEVDGQLEAALSLATGEAIANPFAPTLELVRLLELRARQLRTAGGRRRSTTAHLSPA